MEGSPLTMPMAFAWLSACRTRIASIIEPQEPRGVGGDHLAQVRFAHARLQQAPEDLTIRLHRGGVVLLSEVGPELGSVSTHDGQPIEQAANDPRVARR